MVSWSSPQVSDASASEIETVSIMVSRDGPIDAGHHDDDTDRARWTVRRREGKVGNVVRHLDPDQCLALRHSYSFARRPVEAEVGDGPFAVKLGQYTLLKENAPNDCQYSCRVLEANLRAAAVLAGLMVASWTAGATPVVVTVLGWILLIRGIVLVAISPKQSGRYPRGVALHGPLHHARPRTCRSFWCTEPASNNLDLRKKIRACLPTALAQPRTAAILRVCAACGAPGMTDADFGKLIIVT